MSFDDADLLTMLQATGEQIAIKLSGVTVATPWCKFREDFVDVSPYDASVGNLGPAVLVKTSDLVGITSSHVFVIGGVEYKYNGSPERKPSGLTLVKLGKK